MIVVIGRVHVPATDADDFAAGLPALVAATCDEPGCVSYEFWRHRTEPGVFHIVEEWVDDAALERHQRTDHYREFARDMRGRTIEHIEATRYEVSHTQRLR